MGSGCVLRWRSVTSQQAREREKMLVPIAFANHLVNSRLEKQRSLIKKIEASLTPRATRRLRFESTVGGSVLSPGYTRGAPSSGFFLQRCDHRMIGCVALSASRFSRRTKRVHASVSEILTRMTILPT